MSISRRRSVLTLMLTTLLHAFTHAFGSMLVPLYLLIAADMHLGGVRAAALIVTIYLLVYNLSSYPAGMLADRFDRKWLLGIGLLGNSLAIGAMGLSRHYPELLGLAVVAGLFGSLFHPTANALVPAHFPKNPGLAIGMLGIGSGIGFFVGPQFAGWQAQAAHWHFDHIAAWQRPCVELAAAGVVGAIVFLIFAKETRSKDEGGRMKDEKIRPPSPNTPANGEPGRTGEGGGEGTSSFSLHPSSLVSILPARMATEEIVLRYETYSPGAHLPAPLFWRVVGIGSTLGLRDFAGVATTTLASIYLQKAFTYSPKQAGLAVGLMMLMSVLVNPVSVYLTGGKRRLPMLAGALIIGGVVLACVPMWSGIGAVIGLCLFQTFQLGSYAMSDASILERVAPDMRGRVVGVFLTIAGTFAACAPFVIASWTDLLGLRGGEPRAYAPIFFALGGMMIVASLATKMIGELEGR